MIIHSTRLISIGMKYLSPKVMLLEGLYYLYNLPVLVANKHNLHAEKHGAGEDCTVLWATFVSIQNQRGPS
jgi:hypothetical protein